LLRATGFVRRGSPARWVAAAGLAYLCGVSGVMLVAIVLLILGVPFSLTTFGVLCVVLALPLSRELPGRTRPTFPRASAARACADSDDSTCDRFRRFCGCS